MRSNRPAVGTVLLALFVFWPFTLLAVLIVLAAVLYFGALFVEAFQEGIGIQAVVATAAIICLIVAWVRAAGRLFNSPRERRPPAAPPGPSPFGSTDAERYAAGDFEHRDYEAEKREHEAWRRELGW